jgi:23S rRNA (pseudouridine1915-N3)-methyltransferase
MRVTVLSVGRPRESTLRDLVTRYLDRSSGLFRAEWTAVADGDPRGSKLPQRAVVAEGARLLKLLDSSAVNVALDERGKARKSRDLARWMGDLRDTGQSVRFVIGGAHGLAPDVLSRCTMRMSLSPMTLPHDLALLLLAEQIYRAKSILAGEPYHHG